MMTLTKYLPGLATLLLILPSAWAQAADQHTVLITEGQPEVLTHVAGSH